MKELIDYHNFDLWPRNEDGTPKILFLGGPCVLREKNVLEKAWDIIGEITNCEVPKVAEQLTWRFMEPSPETTEKFTRVYWWCPGCDELHCISASIHTVTGPKESPTFSPSVLITGGNRCHTYIRNGEIQFLPDCSHSLAGKTAKPNVLPDWMQPDWDPKK